MPGSDRRRFHAALVHFPIACWSFVTLLKCAELIDLQRHLPGIDLVLLSILLVWVGIAFAGAAAIFGLIEYSALPDNSRVLYRANSHIMAVSGSALCFAVVALIDQKTIFIVGPEIASRVAAVVGFILLVIAGHNGGKLVLR